jgi:hypothetical protein
MHRLVACTLIVSLSLVVACKTTYEDPEGTKLVVSPDRMNIQDWSMLADRIAQEMVTSGILTRYGGGRPAGALLNPLRNDTGESFDEDAIFKRIRIALLNTGRIEFITVDSMGLGAEDQAAERARQRQQLASGLEDPLADVPQLTVQAKIFRDQVRAEGKTQSGYFLHVTLTDTQTGRGIWEGEASIVKRGSKSTIGF